ncbi:MAG: thermonuclease family protein [Desulfobacterales bacterium]|jgi:micrococcal nuclease
MRYTVKWVNDGDTIVLTNRWRVRYIGIDTPEIDYQNQKAQPYGYEARSFNKKLVSAGKIRLEFDQERHDRYGRLLAYIFLADGSFLNAQMLENGLAYYLYRSPNLKYHRRLLKAQRDGMSAQKGLWRNWKEKKGDYIGNRNSRRFHRGSCPNAKKIKLKNRTRFSTKWDAFHAGYAPAKQCIREFWSYE